MNSIIKYIFKCLWVIATPAIIMLAVYLIIDPFMVLYDYDNYAPSPGKNSVQPHINKGMISLKNFERYYPEMHFDAFIMGSSVSIPYKVEYWAEHLPADARPIHFDSAQESVHSLRLKLEYLKRQGVDINHVLIVVPPQWLEFEDSDTPPFINRPEIDPRISKLAYHWMYLKSFYNRDFFRSYTVSKLLGTVAKVATTEAVHSQPIVLDPATNEESLPLWEDSVRHHADAFYALRPYFANPRVPHTLPKYLTPEKEADLNAIADILDEAGTDYYIIIGPTLSKDLPAPEDIEAIESAFGDRLYDFSASMAYKADCDTNFFDFIHYRYPVAKELMDSVYTLPQR